MSALTKKPHVHFCENVLTAEKLKSLANVERTEEKMSLNYSRDQLLEMRKHKFSLVYPTFMAAAVAGTMDFKQKERLQSLIRPPSKEMDGLGERRRNSFPMLPDFALSNIERESLGRNRRIGSGRITDSMKHVTWDNTPKAESDGGYGVDYRFSNNDFFDQRKRFGGPSRKHQSSSGNRNASEPEWVKGGPTSQHDVIELHGFDGPIDDDDPPAKVKDGNTTMTSSSGSSPPARSTPAKGVHPIENAKKADGNFNFEDFLKIDLQSGSDAGVRHVGPSQSKFASLFNQHQSETRPGHVSDALNNFLKKAHSKKGDATAKKSGFRSVKDLEADLQTAGTKRPTVSSDRTTPTLLNIFSQTPIERQQHQQNFIQILKAMQQQEQVLMRREAQHILERLGRNEINMLHILQQLGNPATTIRDRETLMAVVNYYSKTSALQQMQMHQIRLLATQLNTARQMAQPQFQNLLQQATNTKKFDHQNHQLQPHQQHQPFQQAQRYHQPQQFNRRCSYEQRVPNQNFQQFAPPRPIQKRQSFQPQYFQPPRQYYGKDHTAHHQQLAGNNNNSSSSSKCCQTVVTDLTPKTPPGGAITADLDLEQPKPVASAVLVTPEVSE